MRRSQPRFRRSALIWLALLGLGLGLPALAQQGAQLASGACSTMGPRAVEAIAVAVLLGSVIALALMEWRLRVEGWSLAEALSESVARPGGEPRLEASSSRLIAMAGMLVLLLLYLGFGIFALYSFGMTCTMPSSIDTVTHFLYAGLTLFAPYIANKFSNVFRPMFLHGRTPSESSAAAPEPTPQSPAAPAPVADAQPAPAAPTPRATPAEPTTATAAAPTAPSTAPPAAVARSTEARPATTAQPAAAEEPHPAPITPAARASAPATVPATAAARPAAAVSAAAGGDPYAAAVSLIAEFEGFVDHAYPDPASGGEPWTIGYGFTQLQGRAVRPGDTISRSAANAQLSSGVQACAAHLGSRIPYWNAMAADQRCALISFAWNLGFDFYGDESNFHTISLRLRDHDWAAVPAALLLYCDPGTAVEAGLRRRRQAEGDLWRRGMTASPAAATVAAATVATATQPAAQPATPPASATRPTGGHPNPLNVPWFDQLNMDDGQGWRDCFSASSAMLAAYWGKEPNENTYNHLRQHYGDSTSSDAQLAALRQLGLKADFHTDGSLDTLKSEIDAGRPVAVGWLHHGPVSAPSGGGHWTVVIGYDDTGVIMNDPYGSCDLVNGGYPENHNGARQHYSFKNWRPRWQPQGSGGWYLVCQP
jgi:GH24 family phage-related lysozyme (muramidase)